MRVKAFEVHLTRAGVLLREVQRENNFTLNTAAGAFDTALSCPREQSGWRVEFKQKVG